MEWLLEALGLVGDVLDTPGGMLRDSLAGQNPLANVFRPNERTTGRELLEMLGLVSANQEGLDAGDVGGFGVEMLLDPVNLLGGAMLKPLRKAAKLAGPKYGGGIEKLLAIIPDDDIENFMKSYVQRLEQSPEMERVLAEIPEGSEFLGHGTEAFALKTPQSDVLRIEGPLMRGSAPIERRPNIPEVLQPTREVRYGEHVVERLPLAETRWREDPELLEAVQALKQSVGEKGRQAYDIGISGNVGRVGDEWKVLDRGTVSGPRDLLSETPLPPPVLEAIGQMMGYDTWARRGIEGRPAIDPLLASLFGHNVLARVARGPN